MTKIDLASRLKQFRAERNMSQTDLAELVKVSQATIQLWESRTGRDCKVVYPHLLQLVRLCEVMGKSINEVLGVPVPKEEVVKLRHVFEQGGLWYFYFIRPGMGRQLMGPYSTWNLARVALRKLMKGSTMILPDITVKPSGYPGVNWYKRSRRWVVRKGPRGNCQYLGQFINLADAIACAKQWDKDHGNAQRKNNVRPGRRDDDVGPGPRLSRPEDRNVGKRLQGDEATLCGEEKTLPGGSPGILSRSIHSKNFSERKPGPTLSDIQKIVSRNQLPWKVK